MNFNEFKKDIKNNKRKTKDVIVIVDTGGDRYHDDFVTLTFKKMTDDAVTLVDRHDHKYVIPGNYMPEDVVRVFGAKKDTAKKLHKVRNSKSPKNDKKHVGVEIELVSELSEMEMELLIAENGLEDNVQVKEDGSLESEDDYKYTHELCILGDEENIQKIVKKVCKILQGNSNVNKSCGLHVHLDMRHRDVTKSYANLFEMQALLYSMCPITRYRNTYCLPSEEYREFHGDAVTGRYTGINTVAYGDHRTIEIRIHSGTLLASKINNWIRLLIKIADKDRVSVENVDMINDYETVRKQVKLRGKLELYVKERLAKFAAGKRRDKFKIAV